MNKNASRFTVFDKVCYQRAKETFPFQDGNMELENSTYLASILDVHNEVDCSIISNAINLSHSWAILGEMLPQRVMNKVLLAAFYHPKLIPKLAEIAATCDGRSWIFHSILKIAKQNMELLMNSIREDNPVWTEFLLNEFADDFYDKSIYVEMPYDQRPFAFLIESILFGWPVEKTANVEIGRDIVTSVVQFCLDANSKVGNTLLSYLGPVFPEHVIKLVADGFADRLNAQSLVFFYKWEHKGKPKLCGNPAIMAEKLLPRDPKEAERLMKLLDANDPERETLEAMMRHFNKKTRRFVVE